MRLRPLLALLAALWLSAPNDARATVMLHRSVDELASMADAVVVATAQRDDRGALASRSYWREGRIYTDVTLSVNAAVSGPLATGSLVVVQTPGGVVGELGQTVAGAPVFRAGETFVVFLQRAGSGAWVVLDMAAGMLPVAVDRSRGMVVFPSRAEGITFVEPAGGRVVEVAAEGEALVPFIARVRRAVR